jgi:uncharacterized protein (TIGR02996 family)
MTRTEWLATLRESRTCDDFLVYADWLEEQDDSTLLRQAELIRLGVGIHRSAKAPSYKPNADLERRQDALLRDVPTTWAALGLPVLTLLDVADAHGEWRVGPRSYYGPQSLVGPRSTHPRGGMPDPEIARLFLTHDRSRWPLRQRYSTEGAGAWELDVPDYPCVLLFCGMAIHVLCSRYWWQSNGVRLCGASLVERVLCWDAIPYQRTEDRLDFTWYFPTGLPSSISAYLHNRLRLHGESRNLTGEPLVEMARRTLTHHQALDMLSDAWIWWATWPHNEGVRHVDHNRG